ncbi:SDR family NAD(P)-dependent oxidoreductase [Allokutzneria albata]|uniref:NAD(P)-dependent dehydrogenase, short-chain alcohol dehydrogenase family n=1 Tax=Allokutzneria albata TaxID=211114 RepID=A0A1G9RZ97_ALLAB|nr:SDR family NAD(P)-dependent oxidoreductase [Allokutzneria albata]SDM28579.1 NAD(P)-dependent dehydrogenase, short-chain alcohol dehydrogenase family [Allokutzneria albata]
MSDGVALVTGANKGIGKEIARRLAAEGMTVYLGARDPELGEKAADDMTGDVRVLRLDVTDQSEVDTAVAVIDAECGRLDVLVNNAGVVVERSVAATEVSAALMGQAYETNVFGVVAVTRACIPLLRRAPVGRVVNVSSPLGSLSLLSEPGNPIAERGLLACSSSKSALNAITLLYANALRQDGILVNAVSPGLVATDLNTASPFPRGTRTPADGAVAPIRLALLGAEGPSGVFWSYDDVVPW